MIIFLCSQGEEMKTYTFVANWKMNFSFHQSVAFAMAHKEDIARVAQQQRAQIVLCPSFESISSVHAILKDTGVSIGAQDCSANTYGNFTGQVAVESLKEIGCDYIIIGHSERRSYMRENEDDIAGKVTRSLAGNVNPIICFGEDLLRYQQGQALDVIEKQVDALSQSLGRLRSTEERLNIYLAYEPLWAIGTGEIAPPEHVAEVFNIVSNSMQKLIPRHKFRMLYGGSVKGDNHAALVKIEELDGFLIGKASLDFQSFKNIIDYSLEKANQ
jgi:triosephosphate isomerase